MLSISIYVTIHACDYEILGRQLQLRTISSWPLRTHQKKATFAVLSF